MRPADGPRDLAIDAVGEDAVACGLIDGQPADQIIEGALRVQHHRPDLTAQRHAAWGEVLRAEELWLAGKRVERQGTGETPRRIDRDQRHASTFCCEAKCDCRSACGLADTASPDADADPALAENRIEAHTAASSSVARAASSNRPSSPP
jgi:hypothetical protein